MFVGLHDPRDIVSNPVEVATLYRAVNIDDAPDVVMRERFHLIAAGNRRHIGQDLRMDHPRSAHRSEEHTSELQSLRHLVCRLLLEKKKKTLSHRSEDHTSKLQSPMNHLYTHI